MGLENPPYSVRSPSFVVLCLWFVLLTVLLEGPILLYVVSKGLFIRKVAVNREVADIGKENATHLIFGMNPPSGS